MDKEVDKYEEKYETYKYYLGKLKAQKSQFPAAAAAADSIDAVLNGGFVYIDSLKGAMRQLVDNNTQTVGSLFVSKTFESRINKLTSDVYALATAYAMPQHTPLIDSIMEQERAGANNKNWTAIYWNDVPPAGAYTQLNAIRRHCEQACAVALKDIYSNKIQQ